MKTAKKDTKTGARVAALGMLGGAILLGLALGTGLLGPAGEAADGLLSGLAGAVAWLLPAEMLLCGAALARGRGFSLFRLLGDGVLALIAAALIHLTWDGSGGLVGEGVGEAARGAFTTTGAFIVGLLLAGLVLAERVKAVALAERIEGMSLGGALSSLRARRVPVLPDHEPASPAPISAWTRYVTGESQGVETEDTEDEDAGGFVATEEDDEDAGVFVATAAAGAEDDTWVDARADGARNQDGRRPSVVCTFELPPTKLLGYTEKERPAASDAQLDAEARLLASTLGAYDVTAKIEHATHGPTVTTFEASLAAGTKLSKVIGLADDLSLTFGRKVRVVPSRPGCVGFEVANEARATVGLRELLESEGFRAAKEKMSLPVVLGRDVRGEGVYADLAETPHVLMAGATGAGKSVGLNVVLASLLYSKTPEELRLVMIDPKVVELQPYARIPHMLLPVVTDASKAVAALHWVATEMESRYQLLAKAGCKNIASYNAKCKAADKLPHVVIVVDEYADLYASQGKAVDALISRLAQKARAAGMHMILATQRPSVDVVTGTIKANFPTRVAFRVAQRVDSRVVLDEQGAEQLTGRGDMLVKMGGSDAALRVQCPMITEAEIEGVTAHLAAQGAPDYDAGVLDPAPAEPKEPKARKGSKKERVWS
jgi:S-DNA-T family DNA segregation ATPase FtsK/SpoIIIE